MNLSVVILTKNEAKNIGRALESVKSLSPEIFVVDDNSADKTVQIAEKHGAKVYTRELKADFAAQRNFGLEKAAGRWVLFLDADEQISPELADEIKLVLARPSETITGYYLKRRDFLWGKEMKYGEFGRNYLLRLARKTAGKWQRPVHETWRILGKTKKLEGFLNHYPHQSLKEFTEHVRVFSELHAKEHFREGNKSSLIKIILWPKFKFIDNYVLKGGYFDGQKGFVAAMMMTLHSFLAWSNLWLMQKYKHSPKS